MIRTIKIIVLFVSVVLMAWLLPWLFHFALSTPSHSNFMLYSCVAEKFVYPDYQDGLVQYRDLDGGSYTEKEYDSLLPFFCYRQLLADGRLPETIRGVRVTPRSIGIENFMFRSSPMDVNVRKARLYYLMESRSGRVDLKMPDDVFRMGPGGIEFIDVESNSVNPAKSAMFNKVFADKGFAFPVREISGNPTTRKEYDEGYLLVDSTHRVWHFKMVAGRPFLRDTGISPALGMKYAFITEFQNRSMLGYFTDRSDNFYVLTLPDYQLRQIPIGTYDPACERITIFGDMLNWTIRITSEGRHDLYAINTSDFSLAARHHVPTSEDRWDTAGEYVFPFEISFTSLTDQYVKPRVGRISWCALVLNVLLAAVYVFVRRRTGELKGRYVKAAFIVPFGLFLFIPLMVMKE